MAFATNFDRYLMKSLMEEKLPGYKWETGWAPRRQPWKVDLAGDPRPDRKPLVLIETELKKDNPVENVVKVWRWAKNVKYSGRILFIHVFSAHYVKSRPYASAPTKVKQYERATFIGEQMKDDQSLKIDYIPLAIKFRPRMAKGKVTKEGGGAMHNAAQALGQKIAGLLTKELSLSASD